MYGKNPLGMIGLSILVVFVLLALFADVLAPPATVTVTSSKGGSTTVP